MIAPEITYNLDRLAISLRRYAELSGKTEEETLLYQGRKLAFAVYRGLHALMPVKGSIKAERLAALKAGKGVKVRPVILQDLESRYGAQQNLEQGGTFRVREIIKNGKRMNIQALAVERELALRESGRGFSAHAVPKNLGDVESRYGFTLSSFIASLSQPVKQVVLRWLGRKNEFYSDAATALESDKQEQVLNNAIEEVNADIVEYIQRKLDENKHEAGL